MVNPNPSSVSEHLKIISFRPETFILPLDGPPRPQEELQYLYAGKLPVKTNKLQKFFDAQVPPEIIDLIAEDAIGSFTDIQKTEIRKAAVFHHSRRIRIARYTGATMCAVDEGEFMDYFERLTLRTIYEPYKRHDKKVVPRKEVKRAYRHPFEPQPMEAETVYAVAYFSYFNPGSEAAAAKRLSGKLKANSDNEKVVDPKLPYTRKFIELVLDKDTNSDERHKLFARKLFKAIKD